MYPERLRHRRAAAQREELASSYVKHGLLPGTRCASLPQASFANYIAPERESLVEGIAKAVMELLGDRVAPLERRIKDLELQIATLTGVTDVLRGRGAPGSFNVKGTFIPDALYLANDVVACNGSSFIALKDRPGPCPGDGWQLLASRGSRGAKGERGPQGPCGKVRWLGFYTAKMALLITHSDGVTTRIPLRGIFKDIRVDPTDYSVKFSMSDGGELSFSLYSLFSRYDDEKSGR